MKLLNNTENNIELFRSTVLALKHISEVLEGNYSTSLKDQLQALSNEWRCNLKNDDLNNMQIWEFKGALNGLKRISKIIGIDIDTNFLRDIA